MADAYDEIEVEDMDWNETLQAFTYQCPCGDLFQITMVRQGGHVSGTRSSETSAWFLGKSLGAVSMVLVI
jgi:hypothetical protein